MEFLPDGDTWLLAEFGGDTKEEAVGRAHEAKDKIQAHLKGHSGVELLEEHHHQRMVWRIRESGVGASRIPHHEDAWPSWEDAAVAPEVLGDYLRDFYKILHKYQYRWTIYGHFGDGCIHSRITFRLKSEEGVRQFRYFMQEAADLVVQYGGSLSGEHGDGQARGELLPKMFGDDLVRAFKEFKTVWDPDFKTNPGKVVDPYPLDTNLRVGPDYRPAPVFTHFQFPQDGNSFELATERCFGVGKCRALDGETMCPSFMATREEMHTTRGALTYRSRCCEATQSATAGRASTSKKHWTCAWRAKAARAIARSPWISRPTRRSFSRTTTRAGYGRVRRTRWGSLIAGHSWHHSRPALSMAGRAPLLSNLIKFAAGVTQHRELPKFAPRTFRSWFRGAHRCALRAIA